MFMSRRLAPILLFPRLSLWLLREDPLRAAFKSILALSVALFGLQAAPSAVNTRDQALAELKAAKSHNQQKLTEIEGRLRAMLNFAPETTLNAGINEAQIDQLTKERQELMLRQDFYDRLILQVDTRFKTGDLRGFLSERLVEMARTDLLENKGPQGLWKQMTYLSQSLKKLPERGESVIGFVEGYLKESPFSKPLNPDEYLRTRNYTNTRENVAAAPIAPEKVGELVEKRLSEIESPAPQSSATEPAAN
jgi:hypothetical protein